MENKPFEVNYHSHTKRCGHAEGEDEEFVLSAIKNGYKIYGFSDHVMLPGIDQPGIRGNYEKYAEDYFKSIRSLQEKYKDQIEIHLAFEAEWYFEDYADYYDNLLRSGTLDYMILGQHCFLDKTSHSLIFYGQLQDKKQATRMYVYDLISGMKSHNFIYVAHPDLFMQWYGTWDSFAEKMSREIIEAAKEEHMILEINMGPSRWGKRTDGEDFEVAYPNEQFWHLVKEYGVPCIIGVDNHRPWELETSPYDWVRRFVKRHDLNPLTSLNLPFHKPE